MSNCNGFQMEQDSTKSIGAQQVNCFFSIQNTHPPQLYSDAFGDLDVQCGNSEVNQTALMEIQQAAVERRVSLYIVLDLLKAATLKYVMYVINNFT